MIKIQKKTCIFFNFIPEFYLDKKYIIVCWLFFHFEIERKEK